MSETIKTPENKPEIFKEVKLEINEADGLHNVEITLDENNPDLVTAYNVAIREICNTQYDLGMFHQTGINNKPGYHAWEVLGSATDAQMLTNLFPLIHQKAEETYARFKELNFF